MIVASRDLASLTGPVTMVDGGFDPLHAGHVDYFAAAAELGLPVLCNVSCDAWVARKHPPLLPQAERVTMVDAFRTVTYVHACATSTAEVLRRLRPRYFAKGADWRDRLPAEEVTACLEGAVEVVFLDTVVESSTAILERYLAAVRANASCL
jgi:bifunctional ADP-heptose synthase (sugar kinase/adenylyltransferase)